MNVFINKLVYEKPFVEIVERKGIGHPDTICDSIADRISIELANFYLKKFGNILHYNTDKAFLSAGEAKTKFGGGEVLKPMKLFLGDRATYIVNGERLPIDEIVKKSVFSWIKENLRFVNPSQIEVFSEIKQGSEELTSIFRNMEDVYPANDTSALVGYAPMTKLEESVLKVEKYLNSKEFKREFPEVGEDIKVMGVRIGDDYKFTFAIAFVDRFIKNENDYFRKKEEVKEKIMDFLGSNFNIKPQVFLNTLDRRGFGENGCYLTVTGTSAEAGDSGEVGRGNRANGIIALNRPSGSEAAAGKNTVSHVGKIYNLLAFDIAREISKETGKNNYVWLLSQIGRKINDPFVVSVQIEDLGYKDKVEEIVRKKFENIEKFIKKLTEGKFEVC